MNFSTKKWNKFLLGEVEQEDADQIFDYESRNPLSQRPFNDLFKGKTRVVVPFASSLQRDLATIYKELPVRSIKAPSSTDVIVRDDEGREVKEGYDIFYKSFQDEEHRIEDTKKNVGWWGVYPRESSKQEFEGGWAAYEERLEQLRGVVEKIVKEATEERDSDGWAVDMILQILAVEEYVRENPGKKEVRDYVNHKKKLRPKKLSDILKYEFGDVAPELFKAWSDNAETLNKDPRAFEKALTKGSTQIIISRAGIDLFRMSDHATISSCHRVSGGFKDCLWAAVKDTGLIAYAVEAEDLKGIDLEADEIFHDEDRSRDTEGLIVPKTRIRLRRYFNTKDNYDLAIPATHRSGGYGPEKLAMPLPGFLAFVTNWAREAQKDLISGKDGKMDAPSFDDFIRMGGHHMDEPDGVLFNNFFGVDKYSGLASHRGRSKTPEELGPIMKRSPWLKRPIKDWRKAVFGVTNWGDLKRSEPENQGVGDKLINFGREKGLKFKTTGSRKNNLVLTAWIPEENVQVSINITLSINVRGEEWDEPPPRHDHLMYNASFTFYFPFAYFTLKGQEALDPHEMRMSFLSDSTQDFEETTMDHFQSGVPPHDVYRAEIEPLPKTSPKRMKFQLFIRSPKPFKDPDTLEQFGKDAINSTSRIIKMKNSYEQLLIEIGYMLREEARKEVKSLPHLNEDLKQSVLLKIWNGLGLMEEHESGGKSVGYVITHFRNKWMRQQGVEGEPGWFAADRRKLAALQDQIADEKNRRHDAFRRLTRLAVPERMTAKQYVRRFPHKKESIEYNKYYNKTETSYNRMLDHYLPLGQIIEQKYGSGSPIANFWNKHKEEFNTAKLFYSVKSFIRSGLPEISMKEPDLEDYKSEPVKEHTEPYQRKVKAKHKGMKIRLIGKGKGKHVAGSYKKKPSFKRTKSASPAG